MSTAGGTPGGDANPGSVTCRPVLLVGVCCPPAFAPAPIAGAMGPSNAATCALPPAANPSMSALWSAMDPSSCCRGCAARLSGDRSAVDKLRCGAMSRAARKLRVLRAEPPTMAHSAATLR